MTTSQLLRTSAIVTAASIVLAGCSKTSPENTTNAGQAASVTVADQWIKAAPGGMTALFGTLKNAAARDVTVVSASSPAAGMVELHEVVSEGGANTMRPKQGGFLIPADGTHVLAPGGDHLMLMDIKQPLQAGSDVGVTLTFEDGSTLPFTAQIRDFKGAAEDYQPAAPSGHAGNHG